MPENVVGEPQDETEIAELQEQLVSVLEGDKSWQELAECRETDPNVFFPSDGVGVGKARRVCDKCIVEKQCLEYALKNRIDHGVWGGKSERERRRILRQRRRENIALRTGRRAVFEAEEG